jgi:hypothetical protein
MVTAPDYKEYAILCSDDGNGEVYSRDETVKWWFSTDKGRWWPFFLSSFAFPTHFRFCDATKRELLSIRCDRRYPFSAFTMFEGSRAVGTISQKSPLLNVYQFVFDSGQATWRFCMPLFTVHFRGTSNAGEVFNVRMRQHDEWYVRMSPSNDNVQLMASIAFVHRERQILGGFDRQVLKKRNKEGEY